MLEVEVPEELADPTLLGNRIARAIEWVLPKALLDRIHNKGCNCDLRQQLFNEWHISYREYKANTKANASTDNT